MVSSVVLWCVHPCSLAPANPQHLRGQRVLRDLVLSGPERVLERCCCAFRGTPQQVGYMPGRDSVVGHTSASRCWGLGTRGRLCGCGCCTAWWLLGCSLWSPGRGITSSWVGPAPPPPLTSPVGGKSPSVGSHVLHTPGQGHFGGCKSQGKKNKPASADVSRGHLWSLHPLGHLFSSRLYCCPNLLPQAVCPCVARGKALQSLSSAVASASPAHLNQSARGSRGQEAGDTALGADGAEAMPAATGCGACPSDKNNEAA